MLLWRAEPPVQKVVSNVVQSRSVPGFGGAGGGLGAGGGGAGGAWMVLATVGLSAFRAQAEEARSVARRSPCNMVAIWASQGLSILE